ncbi:MAG TPA: PEGA domain-containing protein [Terriglobales bacterium]|nr:PEGA domain-containing protein [Terriglobales bacterium]
MPGGANAFFLDDGTPVKLRIGRTVSSADAQVGETVDFEVLEEVRVGDLVVVPKGGLAWATVTEAQPKRRLGRAGKLGLNIDSVKLVDGEKAALRAVKDVKGAGHGGAVTGAVVATAIVFWPAAPLFLLIHGKDITIPKGTEITAYINGAMPLDHSKFDPVAKSPATVATAAPVAAAQLQITSDPDAADIQVDGAFVGNTPSTVSVPAGEHDLEISKTGYLSWKRHLRALGGDVHINAKLEAEPQSQPK